MNVDLIKFVDQRYAIMIYTTEQYWQYLYHVNSLCEGDPPLLGLYLLEMTDTDLLNWRNISIYDLTELFLNKPHMSKVIEMVKR